MPSSHSKREFLALGAFGGTLATLSVYLYFSYQEFKRRQKKSVGEISELYVYPIKSCAGVSVSEMEIVDSGLKYDRLYLIIDPENRNRFITQRQIPKMALLQPKLPIDLDSPLVIHGVGVPPKRVPLVKRSNQNPEVDAIVWGERIKAVDQGNSVALWLSAFLNKNVRLVRVSDVAKRQVDLEYAPKGSTTNFADGFPYLICNETSIKDLNEKVNRKKLQKKEPILSTPLSLKRFRPNIIVKGPDAFDEDFWETIVFQPGLNQGAKNENDNERDDKNDIEAKEARSDTILLSVVKPCTRCQIPTIDPDAINSSKDKTITEVLKAYRTGANIGLTWGAKKAQFLGETIFGQNALHGKDEVGKSLTVGDLLYVTKRKKSFNLFSQVFY